jgi:hypothetical protein
MAEETYSTIFGSDDSVSAEKILNLLNIVDKDISMKTEMRTPFEFSLLEGYVAYLKAKYQTGKKKPEKKFNMLISVLDAFIEKYRPNMVSYNRKGRDETTKVLTARMEDKTTAKSTWDKLLGRNKDER